MDFVPFGFLLDLFVQRLQSAGGLSINLGDHITDFDSSFCRRTADRDTLNKDLFLLVLAGHTQRDRRRLGCCARSSRQEDVEGLVLVAPFDRDRYTLANTFLAKRLEQGIEFNEVGTVDRDQLIAGLHSGFGPRAIGDDLSDHRFGIDVLPDQAQISGKRWRSLADVLTIDDGKQSIWRMELPIQTDPTGHTRW